MRRILLGAAVIFIVGMLAIQLVPYGRDHINPSITGEPLWDSAATRELAVTACFDCHSNETRWPWYSNVAPFSWRVQGHVDEGRAKLNFSECGAREQETDEIAKSVRKGEMPPGDYLLLQRAARLSDADTQTLIDGLTKTFGPGEGEED